MSKHLDSSSLPPPRFDAAGPRVAERVLAIASRVGVVAAAKRLGTTRESVARVAAGLHVRRGTLLVIEAALRELGEYEETNVGGETT